jgi:cobalt transporter subunit CbtA
MPIFRSIVFIAALAGLVAGLAMTGMQYAGTVPLILKSEIFETAAPAHDHGTHASGAAAHEHEEVGWAPADGFERSVYTALGNVVTSIGFALLLLAASELAGGLAGWRQGLFWGLAGFVAFTLAPGLGLPPKLPAMPAADLTARQVWWAATVAATSLGLALLVFRRSLPVAVLAVALIVLPHLVGAPKPARFESPVPPALVHDFVAMVTVVSLVFWATLGVTAGFIRGRVFGTA